MRRYSCLLVAGDYDGDSYNDSGIRTQKTVGSTVTDYYLNGSNIVAEITGGVQTDYYYDENGNVFGFKKGGSEYYYIRNGQSDIIGILDSNGNQVVAYVYDSWGKVVGTTGSLADTIGAANPFRYRGYYYDAETGLYYLNSRYYDPEVGRFINADDCDILDGSNDHIPENNLFAYCFNNPVNHYDSDGCFACALVGNSSLAALLSILLPAGGSNSWRPVGWIVVGATVVVVGGTVFYAEHKKGAAQRKKLMTSIPNHGLAGEQKRKNRIPNGNQDNGGKINV